MKKYIFILLACLVSAGAMLTSCQDVQEPYNNVPTLGGVTVKQNVKQVLNVTLQYPSLNDNGIERAYYLLSTSSDMSDSKELNASMSSGYYTSSTDLLPATTYYVQLCLRKPHGFVQSPVTEFKTNEITNEITVSEITSYSAYVSYYWGRSDCEVTFEYSTNADMSNAQQMAGSRYGNNYNATLKLNDNTKYYVRAKVTLPYGTTPYYSPVKEFTTQANAYVDLTGSEFYSNYAGFWIVSDNYTYVSNWSGTSWSGNISGEADVYVYKPYNKSYTNYKAIPIYYTDKYFEYGHAKISPTNNKVSCPMTTLLPYQVNLNISCKSTNGATSSKYITQVEIANAEKAEAICTNATFDLTNGTMTLIKNNAATWSKSTKIALNYEKDSLVYFNSLIPVKFGENEVKVNITLNNSTNMKTEVIPVTLPSTSWEYGKKYNYDITVNYTRTDVSISVSDVYVQPWSNGGNTDIDIYD